MAEQVEILTAPQQYEFLESFYALSSDSHFWYKWRVAAFLQQIKDLQIPLDANLKILDIGGGKGVLRKQIEAVTNWKIDVTDLDIKGLQNSIPGRGRTMYYDITEERREFKEQYDAILLFDVLEHIEQTEPFIKSLLFHLKSSGYLFINVPALQSLFSPFDQVQGHFRRYNKTSLQKEFQDFSMDVKDVRFWGFANVPVVLARKILLSLSSAGKTKEEVFQQGFKLPAPFVNKAFLGLMQIELNVTKKPPLGSSVLLVGQKH